jgi:selenocysteine-specific elongation factor
MPKEEHGNPTIANITSYHSILIGLLGHVDAGKTAVARLLSEIISTAGLDAHPQSQERGITIDLGFTSLILKDNLITLVDAPGHADLIRSVVASANIIDGAIIVVDVNEGMQIQTAEHMVILESLGIKNIIIVINKIDTVPIEKVQDVELEIRKMLKSSSFEKPIRIVHVSAKNGIGKQELQQTLLDLITKIREGKQHILAVPTSKNLSENTLSENTLIFPIDHHFKIKGSGLIITGTTNSGQITLGDTLTIIPQNKSIKVKSIQVFHQIINSVPKGFRAGIGIIGADNENLERGNILTNTPALFSTHEIIEVEFQFNTYFKRTIRFGSQINCTFGMVTESARIFPFYELNSKRILEKEIHKDSHDEIKLNGEKFQQSKFSAYIWFDEPVYIMENQAILLSQLDLPPTTLRFFASGSIRNVTKNLDEPEINYIKVKNGQVKNPNYGNNTVLIENLAQSKEGAETLIGYELDPPFGKITGTFANKGAVVVQKSLVKKGANVQEIQKKEIQIKEGDPCNLKLFRTLKIQKTKSYDYLWQDEK